jgi:putative transposase
MTTPVRARYTGYRFPAEIIGHAVWLYFRFPLGLRMVEELLAARGIIVSHETARQWARKFGQRFANQQCLGKCLFPSCPPSSEHLAHRGRRA